MLQTRWAANARIAAHRATVEEHKLALLDGGEMNTTDTPQPHTNSPGEDTRAADVRYAVEGVTTYAAAEMVVELVLTHAPELRTWAADTLTQRGYRAAAARLRVAPLPLAARLADAQNSLAHSPAPVLATADTAGQVGVPVDVELARLMVATGVTPAVVLAYWAARAAVSENVNAGGRVKLDVLTAALHRIGLFPAARTLDTWLKRGEAAELWHVTGKGKRRTLYIRSHEKLCKEYTRRAARTRPAAVMTNLPGKLWAVLEFDGSRLTAAAMLGKLWAAWYGMRERTGRIAHATQRDLWNRTRLQLNAARAAADVSTRPGYVTHPHGLPPAHAYPAAFERENGGVIVLPMTRAANAYAVPPLATHRRARRSNYAAYALSADTLAVYTAEYAPAIDGATGQPGRVPESRVYFDNAGVSDNFKRAARALRSERTDTARVLIGQRSLSRYGQLAPYYEQLVVTADDSAQTLKTPAVNAHRAGRRFIGGRLTRRKEDAHFALTGGRGQWRMLYTAPFADNVPRRRLEGICA